jgi:hypothetical protein
MYFCESMDYSPAMTRLQARYVQISVELLAEISRDHNWEFRAQVALWVTAGSIFLRRSDVTHQYIRESCEVVNTARLQFIPTYGKPPEFSEELREKFSVLSQIIYFENFLFLTYGGAEPTMTARIEMEFRHQLQVRPATSVLSVSRIQCFLLGSISGIVQDLSVDYAYTSYFAGQRRSAHT